jgi:hypothetical protein
LLCLFRRRRSPTKSWCSGDDGDVPYGDVPAGDGGDASDDGSL